MLFIIGSAEGNMEKTNETLKTVMQKAILEAKRTMNANMGGPFGAAVISKNGDLIAVASNTVLGDHDPSAHAEINAIRKACAIKETHDLSDCILVTTAYPCPMCLGAIIWANIDSMVYGCRPEDAEAIGFRDDFIYRFIEGGRKDETVVKIDEAHRDMCKALFDEYHKKNKTLY